MMWLFKFDWFFFWFCFGFMSTSCWFANYSHVQLTQVRSLSLNPKSTSRVGGTRSASALIHVDKPTHRTCRGVSPGRPPNWSFTLPRTGIEPVLSE
jgi:hypothetical protein